MATPSQINANRANAQFSTGPSSPEGKLKSCHNALKTGLTGRTIVLPTDDVAAYQKFVDLMHRRHAPEDDYEKHIVQTIADTEWRLLRIPTLEAALLALGRNELAADFGADPNLSPTPSSGEDASLTLEALIFRKYRNEFNNLQVQERRLRRQLEKQVAELKQLHDMREILTIPRRNEAVAAHSAATAKEPFDPARFGFEFSEEYLTARFEASVHLAAEDLPKWDRAWRAKTHREAA
jgi:hypothetical protein